MTKEEKERRDREHQNNYYRSKHYISEEMYNCLLRDQIARTHPSPYIMNCIADKTLDFVWGCYGKYKKEHYIGDCTGKCPIKKFCRKVSEIV